MSSPINLLTIEIGLLKRWIKRVLRCPGAPLVSEADFDAGFHARGRVCYSVRSDACMHDPRLGSTTQDPPGLGGHLFGRLWYLPLAPEQCEVLTIPIAELTAWFMGAIINESPLEGSELTEFEIDALASPTVLSSKRGADAEGMMLTHKAAMKHPLFVRKSSLWRVRHCFGDGNPIADACSRGAEQKGAEVVSG